MKTGLGVSHGSQEWGGKGLGRLKMKHEKGVGYFVVPKECGGKGLGRLEMKHEKGFGCFMVHKSGVGRAWEGSKWFPKVLREWLG